MTEAVNLGVGGLDAQRKPVFVATTPTRFVSTDKESLTDQEKIALKTFQLHRKVLSMKRRDEVYEGVINSGHTTGKTAQNSMGTAFPVVKFNPSYADVMMGHRWYEYALEVLVPYAYVKYALSKPVIRSMRQHEGVFRGIFQLLFLSSMGIGNFRTYFRFMGHTENEAECERYGVEESSARLEEKRKMWEKYAAYRAEWMRRFDYHVYGLRPGETYSIFSPCFIPASETRYNKRTDFRMRDSMHLRGKMNEGQWNVQSQLKEPYVRHPENPLMKNRPEIKYVYDNTWMGESRFSEGKFRADDRQ